MAQVTIDGRAIDFSAGESVIAAATRKDIEIPYYCWHPRLSVAANCRMCLVEVEKAPKLVPACQTECKEGMVVFTANAKVKAAQRAVHEFLLVNHPIDCPICDQAGECKLQDYYMKFHLTASRMADTKVHKRKLTRLGPHVVYNAERCIVCTRCIRFMEEVAEDRQLGVFNRGDHSIIGTYPGKELDNPYSLNTVDVCPVGALTSTAFRFKQRVWNLRRSPSICGGCARGCNIHVDQRSAQVYRILPRENEAVNKSWLCDEGRLTYSRANDNRLDSALVRTGGSGAGAATTGSAPATRGSACALAAGMLLPLREAHAPLAMALSVHSTCEDAYVAALFARDVLRIDTVALLGYADGEADSILRMADKNPNRRGVMQVLADVGLRTMTSKDLLQLLERGDVQGLVCVGHESSEVDALGQAAAKLAAFVHLAHATSALSQVAHVTLPAASWVQSEGTWVNGDGRLQRLVAAFAPQKDGRASGAWLSELAAGMGAALQFPSVAAIQADMRANLASFADVDLCNLPSLGLSASSKDVS